MKSEGAGKTGCALHPRSRMQNAQAKRTRAYRFSGSSPAFPAQWYGLFRALPGDRALSSPSSARSLALTNLTPASGRQDRTTSPYASASFVARIKRAQRCRVHRIPHPTSVTIASRPSCGCETGELVELICPTTKAEYFFKQGWTLICPTRLSLDEQRREMSKGALFVAHQPSVDSSVGVCPSTEFGYYSLADQQRKQQWTWV